jgi:hypothetical protein
MRSRSFAGVLLAAVLLLPFSTSACPLKAYIGLYADEYHSDCRQDTYPYAMFNVWAWVLPSYNGIECVEYRLEKPDWLEYVGITYSPIVIHPIAPNDWFGDGGTLCFAYCRYQWAWVCQYQIIPLTSGQTGYITVHERLSTGLMQAKVCDVAVGTEDLVALNYLALNQPCTIAAESTTWGAIKNMYQDK